MNRFSRNVSKKQLIYLIIGGVGLVASLAYYWRDSIYQLATRASSQTASLTIDVTKIQGKIRNTWGHLAQGGEDLSGNMLSPVGEQLKKLNPQTIRIDHIYDGYNVVSRADGRLAYDWTRLDTIVNSILASGATPMLALSYMPSALATGDVTSVPSSYDEWALVVENTVRHYSKDLGIADVSYEVWNEPDLFGNFKTYGDKNYLTLYRYAAVGAGRVFGAKSYEIGGPATTGYYEAWMKGMLKMAAEGVRLDFVSWHRYSTNLEDYERDLSQAAGILGAYREQLPKGLKIYLTETGPDPKNNSAYDMQSGAAHLVATVATTYDRLARLYTFEIVDGKDPSGAKNWGRWGLLTHPDVGVTEKPRYQAMQWLNRLKGWKLLVGGQGSWVKSLATKHQADGYQIMVVNYDSYGNHAETVPLLFTNLTQGIYTLSREYFGRGKSSETFTVGGEGGLSTNVGLSANQIVFLELLRKP